jgi:hypothetical protein
VTFAAPIGRFEIYSKIKVLAYEFANDPVAKLDLKDNPKSSNWETIILPRNDLNVAGKAKPSDPINVHQMQIYAPQIDKFYPVKNLAFDGFLSNNLSRSDLEIVNYETQLVNRKN